MTHLTIFSLIGMVLVVVESRMVNFQPIESDKYEDLLEKVKQAMEVLVKQLQVAPKAVLYGAVTDPFDKSSGSQEKVYSAFFSNPEGNVFSIVFINEDEKFFVWLKPRKFPGPNNTTPEDEKTAEEIKSLLKAGKLNEARNATEDWVLKKMPLKPDVS